MPHVDVALATVRQDFGRYQLYFSHSCAPLALYESSTTVAHLEAVSC